MSAKLLSLLIGSTLLGIIIPISVPTDNATTKLYASSDVSANDSQQLNAQIIQARENIGNELKIKVRYSSTVLTNNSGLTTYNQILVLHIRIPLQVMCSLH